MLIVTNRNINKSNFVNGVGDHEAFGDSVNSKGPNEVRLANAEKINKKWTVRLVKEPSVVTRNNIPSRKEFDKIRDHLTTTKKNCVFFVHGFNQDFEKNLEKGLALEEEHGVEVIDLNLLECIDMMADFIHKKPEIWNEDIGEL